MLITILVFVNNIFFNLLKKVLIIKNRLVYFQHGEKTMLKKEKKHTCITCHV
jgi:hypothetical protein